ncbi:hypothetical protein MKY88_13835 [Lysinibacillus sp. FSL R7-0073]|uniref:hypothetical protein n=1 Tax=Lysinibacillus sp. FSL R7-0073 TaxID=2921669 RepID=UPI0030FB55C4
MAKEKFDEEIKEKEQAHWSAILAIEEAIIASKGVHEVPVKKADLEGILAELKKSHFYHKLRKMNNTEQKKEL